MRRASVRIMALALLLGGLLTACGTPPAAPATVQPTAPATAASAQTTAPTAAQSAVATTPQPTAQASPTGKEYIFGMVLVGPTKDGGWNQAHFEAAQYVMEKVPGTKFVFIDKVNSADRPNVTTEQAIEELIAKGAQFIITNSAEYADGTNTAAQSHPDVFFLHASGDKVLTGEAPPNVTNLMGRMEYGKMISGCAAALQSESGKIAYLGPLTDPETRRLVNSAYLGAKYCWENQRGKPADSLKFKVTWIGFWFNIPGVTLDPTKVATDFINEGYDVIISGIDTTEGIIEANKATAAGKKVWAIPYDYKEACAQGAAVCLGVPYFNWGPRYAQIIADAKAGKFKSQWEWLAPDWTNMNNPDTSMVGFVKGPALTKENQATLDSFISKLADGSLDLYKGPLFYQDGSQFVAAGAKLDDKTLWNTQQLLKGIEGQSASSK